MKIYYGKTKERWLRYAQERNQTPSGIYNILKTRSKKIKVPFSLNKKGFSNWWYKQKQICFYCKVSLSIIGDGDYRYSYISKRLSIDRMDNKKGYRLGNLALACNRCNTIKSNFFSVSEMLKIGKIVKNKYLMTCTRNQ